MSIHELPLNRLDGTPGVLDSARGKVALLVNVASRCGLTPQYEQLEALHERYSSDGFTVIGFPCNQFLEQEPGSPEEIAEFCSTTYGVTFPLSEKIEVNGDGRHALYSELTRHADASGHAGDIRWNFEKFLVGRDGTVLARFEPTTSPDAPEVVAAIESALGRP
ncbi:MAG: glutathione peroxidase [Microthrixaceae bacterium]|nr:glutathione peroxidase [Microthrixaceae bacterium]